MLGRRLLPMASARPSVEAVTLKVEDVLARLREGSIRIPSFQRPLNWKAKDNLLFFDSLLGGYPVGSLLMWMRAEEPARVQLGPFVTEAGSNPRAWRVVDGQQRLTALAGALLPLPGSRPSDFDFGVDLATEKVMRRPKKPLASFVPLEILGNVDALVPFLHANPAVDVHKASTVSKRLREYPLSIIVLDADDQAFAEDVFTRLNRAGKPLTQVEVFRASHGRRVAGKALAGALAVGPEFRFGPLDESNLLRAMKALAGQDPISDLKETQAGDEDALIRGTREAVVLVKKSGVPTADLLPFSLPLGVLVAFFARHANVAARTRQLLEYWFWRATLSFRMKGDFSSIRNLYKRAVIMDEHESSQMLLEAVPAYAGNLETQPDPTLKSAVGQILALVMIEAGPRDLETGQLLNTSALLEAHRPSELFQPVGGGVTHAGLINSIFHPRLSAKRWRSALESAPQEVLRSHFLRPPLDGSIEWINERGGLLRLAFDSFAERKTGIGQSTRPALASLGEPES